MDAALCTKAINSNHARADSWLLRWCSSWIQCSSKALQPGNLSRVHASLTYPDPPNAPRFPCPDPSCTASRHASIPVWPSPRSPPPLPMRPRVVIAQGQSQDGQAPVCWGGGEVGMGVRGVRCRRIGGGATTWVQNDAVSARGSALTQVVEWRGR